MHRHTSVPLPQRGFALVEVMIAFMLLSVGLLGFSALQVRTVKATQSSFQRTDASNLALNIMEAMRANKAAAINPALLAYNLARTCSYSPGSPRTLAINDLDSWFRSMKIALGDVATTCADITCTDKSSAAPGMCTVNIYWDDSRAMGGSSTQSVQLVGRL
ncbi:MAG: type IV pilus modification protein PilV [Rhodoferax sp.]